MHEGELLANYLMSERPFIVSRTGIMFSHWFGEAYKRFRGVTYSKLRVKAWEGMGVVLCNFYKVPAVAAVRAPPVHACECVNLIAATRSGGH